MKDLSKVVLVCVLALLFITVVAVPAAEGRKLRDYFRFIWSKQEAQAEPEPLKCHFWGEFVEDGKPCCDGIRRYQLVKRPSCCGCPDKKVCTYCGDGICGPLECEMNCPEDCGGEGCFSIGNYMGPIVLSCCEGLEQTHGCSIVPFHYACINCGDGVCASDFECRYNCPEDCSGGPFCGNGRCEKILQEDPFTCPDDCGGRSLQKGMDDPPKAVEILCSVPEEGGRKFTDYTCGIRLEWTDYNGLIGGGFDFGDGVSALLFQPYPPDEPVTDAWIIAEHAWSWKDTFTVCGQTHMEDGTPIGDKVCTTVVINKAKFSRQSFWQDLWRRIRF